MRKMRHTAKKKIKLKPNALSKELFFLFCKHVVFDGHSVSMLLSLVTMCHNKVSTSLLMVAEVR